MARATGSRLGTSMMITGAAAIKRPRIRSRKFKRMSIIQGAGAKSTTQEAISIGTCFMVSSQPIRELGAIINNTLPALIAVVRIKSAMSRQLMAL